jgi:hypothetical protein
LPTESVETLAKEEHNQVLQTVMSHPDLLNDDSEIPFSDKLASQQHITKADLDMIDQSTDLKVNTTTLILIVNLYLIGN